MHPELFFYNIFLDKNWKINMIANKSTYLTRKIRELLDKDHFVT